MLNITLDEESAEYLSEILEQENTTSEAFLKQLLQDRWQSLKAKPSILDRMGGYPEELLQGPEDLSDRDVCKKLVKERIQTRHTRHSQQP